MLNLEKITKELYRIEALTLNNKQEIKTLKNRVRAYKGWTRRYRRQQQKLEQDNVAIALFN